MIKRLIKHDLFSDFRYDPEAERESITETIFTQYRNAMFRIAQRILHDDWLAEDAVMDTLTKICSNPSRFEGLTELNLKLLVMRTVENSAIDILRKRQHIQAHEVLDSDDELEIVSAADEPLAAEEFGRLDDPIHSLPDPYQQIIILRYGEGYTNREIAKMLAIPESTVSTWLERARKLLKSQMLMEEKDERAFE
ncbi:MAG: sigma-70 family RNA polymerase sigma factor [Clostridia bacterium]|nr:sigma-70 family RNA polymerase sigma factor [Clostridia bacterium]